MYADNDTFVSWNINIDESDEFTSQVRSKMSYNIALHNFFRPHNAYKVRLG